MSRQLAATAFSLAGERDAKIKSAGEWRARASAVASPMDPGDEPVIRTEKYQYHQPSLLAKYLNVPTPNSIRSVSVERLSHRLSWSKPRYWKPMVDETSSVLSPAGWRRHAAIGELEHPARHQLTGDRVGPVSVAGAWHLGQTAREGQIEEMRY